MKDRPDVLIEEVLCGAGNRAEEWQDLDLLAALAALEKLKCDRGLEGPRKANLETNGWKWVKPWRMEELLKTFGSEVPVREPKLSVRALREASLRKRFRTWNPNFFIYFEWDYRVGDWAPKLGDDIEIERRKFKRRKVCNARR